MKGGVRGRKRLAVWTVGGLGVVTLLAHGFHLMTRDLPPLGIAFGVLIPSVFSVALIGAAIWLDGRNFDELALRVAAWCLVGGLVLVAVSVAFTVFQFAVGTPVTNVEFVLIIQATVGGLLGFLLGVYDTQRLVTRRELLSERETANRLGRRLTVLNRVLRHDVRNSVNVIRGNAEIILDGTDDPETVAETIHEHASEMVRLSEQAREVEAALSTGDVETERFDLSTAVSAKALALKRRHGYASVHRSVEDGAWVEASPLVETAVENLLRNAVEHNAAASPTVWVDLSVDERDGREFVSTRIEDDGPGIPPEQIAVLERGRETALEHTSGLGLWLVNWIVGRSGGELSFEERTPRGSVVELVLPRTDPPESPTTPEVDPESE